jgi:Holliday junction resolvasome RuvABC ATP-dependent DNA helicase subunit
LAWLTPEDQARLAAFKAYAVNHAGLDEVDRQLTQAILEPAGFAHV